MINAGPAIWLIDNFHGWNDNSLEVNDRAVTLFRYATKGRYAGLALEPGRQALHDMPSYLELHLELDAALQAEWETISRLTAAAEVRLRAAVINRSTPAGRAVIKCGLAGYGVGQDLGSFNSATTARDVLDGV
jgi:hypothetical protein